MHHQSRAPLPREAEPKGEERTLVFLEGQQAEELWKAGAHIVGGPELVEVVRSVLSKTIATRQSHQSFQGRE